jgi:hypothetical protein
MTGVQLATVSTALWVVATVALFILLAGWSTGSSWGLTASLVRGVRGWSDRPERPISAASPPSEQLRPILDPYAFVRRPARRSSSNDDPDPGTYAEAQTAAGAMHADIVELGERHLPG